MKKLELKLKKEVIIVENEFENKIDFIDNELGIFYFLCKGSELTEEIASEFMSDFDAFNGFTLNYEYLINLIYMIENKGFYWLENPIEKPINRDEYYRSEKVDSFEILLKEWQEAEEKTFKNPLIFVKNE